MVNKDIVLFDMDGTLTEPRKSFSQLLSSPLRDLVSYADIGIVTGSDYDYVQEQMGSFLNDHSFRYSLHILPCNGTKYYKPPSFPYQPHTLTESSSMISELGKNEWRSLMEILIENQMKASELDIPLTGHFIFNRGSMVNWCPMGRNATSNERQKFTNFDKKYKFRKRVINEIKSDFANRQINNITVKLGGETSFDIYPTGWDKTYSLRYFNDRTVWFVGDRAHHPRGNDYEIFKACEPRSFHTTGPEETVRVVLEIIEELRKRGRNGYNK